MITVSAELSAAIEAAQRHPLVRLTADWDAAGTEGPQDLSAMVESITVERSLAGDLPDDVTIVEGSAAASLDVTFANPSPEGIAASRFFNRLNPDSPLFGKELLTAPVTADIGFQTSAGPQFVRRFTGLTRSLKASSGARTARMTALDLRERLTWDRDLPLVGRGGYGLNASWALSSVIQQAAFLTGFFLTPAPESRGNGRYLPMHGSLHQLYGVDPDYTARVIESYSPPTTTTGTTWGDRTREPSFTPGPYVAGCLAGPVAVGRFFRGFVRGEITDASGYSDLRTGRVEFYTKQRSAASGEGSTAWRVAVVYTNGDGASGVMAGIDAAGRLVIARHTGNPDTPTILATGPAVPADGGWHYVGLGWDAQAGAGSATFTLRLDATTQTDSTAAFPAPFTSFENRVYWRQPISELVYQARPDFVSAQWMWDRRDVVNVKLDYSSLELDIIPETASRPVWEWLREIGAGEQATVALDEAGILRYRTASRLSDPAAQIPVKVITAEKSLLDLGIDDAIDAVKNEVRAIVHPVTVGYAMTSVHTSADVWAVGPRDVGHLTLTLAKPALEVDHDVRKNRSGDPDPDPATTYVCVAFNPDGASTGDPVIENMYGWIFPELEYRGGTSYDLGIRNDTDRILFIATTKPNTPLISIAGKPVTIASQEIASTLSHAAGIHPSIRRHGPQVLKLADSPWRQRQPATLGLVQRLLYELYQPIPVVHDLDIVGDPRLQLGDRVRITDRDGLALDADYWVMAIRETLSRSTGYRMRITARRANTTLRWGAGRWGVNTWGVI